MAIDAYNKGEIDTVEVAYPSFVNVLVQDPVIRKILPIVDLGEILEQIKERFGDSAVLDARSDTREMVFEPSVEELLRTASGPLRQSHRPPNAA